MIDEMLGIIRLREMGTFLAKLPRFLRLIRYCSRQDDLYAWTVCPDPFGEAKPVQRSGGPRISKHNRDLMRIDDQNCFVGVPGLQHLISALPQILGDRLSNKNV